MPVKIEALPTVAVRALQDGGLDEYGNPPEVRVSDGNGVPCRHCLEQVAEGEDYLIVAYRPFGPLQPYAETGPIFLHASKCTRAPTTAKVADRLESPDYIVRGYGADERIVYGTGKIVPTDQIETYAETLLNAEGIEFVHVRSAQNNCYQCRVERA